MAALGMGVLGACGASEPGSTPATAPPTTATGSATGSPGGAATSPGTDATTPSPSGSTYLPSPEPELTVPARPLGQVERLSGVIGEGVESGCRLLTPDADGSASPSTPRRALALLSSDARLVPGAHVTVEGHRGQDTVTTCQQGVPFTVTRVITVR